MNFLGALCGFEDMNQRYSCHHNSLLHLHFLLELFFCFTSRMKTHHIVLQCIPGSEHCSMSYSKLYLLILKHCLWASPEWKNVNGNYLKMKQGTQTSWKVTVLSENCTHVVEPQNTYIFAWTQLFLTSFLGWHIFLNADVMYCDACEKGV